jgi:predicted SAM-dependent methyltransferase
MKLKLNLGCGKDIKKDYLNCDCISSEGVDKVFNLDRYPWPFKEDTFEEILCNSILEHLDKPEQAIREIWRISKPNARIQIIVPHFSCWQAWGDITHKRPYNSTSLFSFSKNITHRSSKSLVNTQNETFEIDAKILFGKIKKLFMFEKIINLNNYSRGFYERHWAYILPAQNILFKLKANKR